MSETAPLIAWQSEAPLDGAAETDPALRRAFVEAARDSVMAMSEAIEGLEEEDGPQTDAQAMLRAEVAGLKNLAAGYRFSFVWVVANAFEDYLAPRGRPAPMPHTLQEIRDVERFLEQLTQLLDRISTGDDISPAEQPAILHRLPARAVTVAQDTTGLGEKEVLLVTASTARTLARALTRELGNLGFRAVVSSFSPLEAFAIAVRMRPGLIISSLEMKDLTGIELARALSSVGATSDVPFCLLTSFAPGDPHLAGLPPNAAVVHIGRRFAEDLASALIRFRLV